MNEKIDKKRIAKLDVVNVHSLSSLQPKLLFRHIHDENKSFPIVRMTQNREGWRYRQRVIRLNVIFLFHISEDFLAGYHFASFFADFLTSS